MGREAAVAAAAVVGAVVVGLEQGRPDPERYIADGCSDCSCMHGVHPLVGG